MRMPSRKLSDHFYDNRKLLAAGLEATGLYARALSYGARHDTRGYIPTAVVPVLAVGSKRLTQTVAALVREELWEPVQGGYQIHDWDHYDWGAAPQRAGGIARARGADRDPVGRFSTPSSTSNAGPDAGPATTSRASPAGPASTSSLLDQQPSSSGSKTAESAESAEPRAGSSPDLEALALGVGSGEGQNRPLEQSIQGLDLGELQQVLTYDQAYLLRKIAAQIPAFLTGLQPAHVLTINRRFGAETLTEALRRLAESTPDSVENPAGYLDAIVEEIAS